MLHVLILTTENMLNELAVPGAGHVLGGVFIAEFIFRRIVGTKHLPILISTGHSRSNLNLIKVQIGVATHTKHCRWRAYRVQILKIFGNYD